MNADFSKSTEKIDRYINLIGTILIFGLIIFSLLSSLFLGLSWDENFHFVNGMLRFEYLKTLGNFKDYNYNNNQYYPGLYDTIQYSIGYIIRLIDQNFYKNYLAEILHLINFFFSVLSIIGFYLITKVFFNKSIATLASSLTLLNPFFFGHMGINPKDIVIFFSLIWFCYFFYKYLNNEKNTILNLIMASFFIGFGCGVRLSFLITVFPVILCGLIYLFRKFNDELLYLIKRLTFHFLLSFFTIMFLISISWPHLILSIMEGNFFTFIFSVIKNSIAWNAGPSLGLINGQFYETYSTPSTYFLDILRFRMPFFISILFFFSYFLIITNNNTFKLYLKNFDKKFIIINFIFFFPIIISILLHVKIYDNLRLFLFLIPLLSLVASFSLYHLLKNFKKSSRSKLYLLLVSFFFSIFIYRFIILTPYQYSYVNFSHFMMKNSINKFEHDYWATSFKELTIKIKALYPQSKIDKFKITVCGGDKEALLYYLEKNLNVKKIYTLDQATHIIMTNRASFDINTKITCFNRYEGKNLTYVSRGKLIFSVLREISKKK